MKEITVQDVVDLREKLRNYASKIDRSWDNVQQIMSLVSIDIQLTTALLVFEHDNEVKNQVAANEIFRDVLRAIGEDYSEYEEV